MVRAAVYSRISLDKYGEGLGVERQQAACQELARDRGWRVVGSFEDNDVSAYSRKRRPGFEALVAEIEGGRVDAVVTYAVDRLVRRLADLEAVIALAERTGVTIACVTGDLNLESASGRTNARVLGSVAQGEVENLIERVRRKIDQNVRAGRVHNGGRRPFGYTADRKTLVPDEAAVVREIVERILDGQSLTSIGRDLNRRRIKRPYGGDWYVRNVREAVTRPRIAGLVDHRGEIVPGVKGEWPAIIDEDTFHRVMVAVSARQRHSERWTNARRHLLTGLAVCGVCEARLAGFTQGSGVIAYRCRGGWCVSIKRDETDAFILAEVQKWALDHPVQVTHWADPELDEVEQEIADLEKRKTEVAEQFADGSLPIDMVRTVGNRLQARIDELRDRQTDGFAEALGSRWAQFDLMELPHMPVDDQRAAIEMYVTRVEIKPAKRRGPGFDSSRVEITWRDPERLAFRAIAGCK